MTHGPGIDGCHCCRPRAGVVRKQAFSMAGAALLHLVAGVAAAPGQFVDDFTGGQPPVDSRGLDGWAFFSGDGNVSVALGSSDPGYASLAVDATKDSRGIWWALIRRRVSDRLDMDGLVRPGYELRVETRIRVSHAPRRVNLHLNTQRTTDFHTHLMEFDIADTLGWHTISMTTRDFDVRSRDTIYAQLAMMDWGLERYRVDLDYLRVYVVRADTCGPDHGDPIPYRPPIPDIGAFAYHLPASADAMVDLAYPDDSFNDWTSPGTDHPVTLLTVSGTQRVILRWDFGDLAGTKVAGPGILELTTYDVQRMERSRKDFGMVRVTEILGGDPIWRQEDVTLRALCQGAPLSEVFNDQMVMDVAVTEVRGGSTCVTISRPVLQRLVDGRTPGIAIMPLGAIIASFYAAENGREGRIPKLHFTPAKAP